MVSSQKIKEMIRKQDKRASVKAIKKINIILEKTAEDIIRKAKQNANFFGRRTINEEDISV